MDVKTSTEMKAREEAAFNRGISYLEMMENAGSKAAKVIFDRYREAKTVLILCGRGNNAGDGLVAARVLVEYDLQVKILFLMGEKFSETTEIKKNLLPAEVEIVSHGQENLLMQSDLIIDAVFGTGFRGSLPTPVEKVFNVVNKASSHRIVLDIPSGINSDTGEIAPYAFIGEFSCVFDSYKPLHSMKKLKSYFGELVLLDIGL
jgi:YjeF N-terminal domain protein